MTSQAIYTSFLIQKTQYLGIFTKKRSLFNTYRSLFASCSLLHHTLIKINLNHTLFNLKTSEGLIFKGVFTVINTFIFSEKGLVVVSPPCIWPS